MKKIIFLISLSFFITASFAQGSWVKKANFPGTAIRSPFSFAIGSKGYIGTGMDITGLGTPLKAFWEYDPATDSWTQKADFGGQARYLATGFSIGNKGYAGTGYKINFGLFSDFWEYDVVSNSWTQKASFGGGVRQTPVGFSIGNMGYIGTGWNYSVACTDLWQYNPATDTWIQKASLPPTNGRGDANCFVIGTDAYVIGGTNNSSTCRNDLWQYNSLTDTWVQKASFPIMGRCDAAAFSICNKGYYGTGEGGGDFNDWWLYDPLSDSWLQKANVPGSGRDEPGYFVIGDKGYVGLGSDFAQFYDFYEFTPDSVCSGSLPACAFLAVDTLLCANDCISFTNQSSNATSYKWLFSGGTPSSSTDQNPKNICYPVAGSYTITLIAYNSGGSDTLTISNYITVNPAPPVPSIIQSNDTFYCSTATSYKSYQWYADTMLIVGATKHFYVTDSCANYNVLVTDSNGCKIAVGINTECLGVRDFMDERPIITYPNPASDVLAIHSSYNGNGYIMISILNLPGDILKEVKLRWSNDINININNLSAGIYFLRLQRENGSIVKKFVKE